MASGRMPEIPADKLTEEQKKAVAEMIAGPRGRIGGPFIPLLRSPETLTRVQQLGAHLRFKSALPPRLSEYLILLVARTYQAGDMGQTYPLMRGGAPLIVAFIGTLFLGEPLSTGGVIGIVLICGGVMGMALGSRREQAPAIAYAATNAGVIAAYTLIDGLGARRSGAPAAYTLWVFLLTGLPLALWLAARGRRALAGYDRTALWRPLLGGGATLVSYTLVLWAMTRASIPVVAALRETAILFGAAISILVLKENTRPIRLAAAGVIAAGAAVIRLR